MKFLVQFSVHVSKAERQGLLQEIEDRSNASWAFLQRFLTGVPPSIDFLNLPPAILDGMDGGDLYCAR